MTPLVTVVMPCRNEQDHIADCLRLLLDSDYPPDRLEFMIFDGQSKDRTPEILAECAKEDPRMKVIANSAKIRPVGLDLGLAEATGEIITRADAHTCASLPSCCAPKTQTLSGANSQPGKVTA